MADFIIYILKSALVLGILFLVYFMLFRKETYYHLNRIYILCALAISVVVPSLDIQLGRSFKSSENKFDYVEEAFMGFSGTMDMVEISTAEKVNSFPIVFYLLLAGLILTALKVGFQLYSIYKNIKKYEIKKSGKYKYVLIDQYQSTHSFFNYIFVHKSEFQKKRIKNVLLHEQIHADQLHSLDLLLIGFLSILQWFNPFIYLFKRALVETHEFQADHAVIATGIDKNQYQRLLLAHARSIAITGFTSSFNQSIIKNRLKMMNKIKSSNKVIFKYVMAFPIVFFIGIFFAISQEKINESIVEIINISNDGDSLRMTSDFAIVDMPKDDRYKYQAEEMISFGDRIVRMQGNVHLESYDKNISVTADNILINKEEGIWYAYTDDYVPSISPINVTDYKKITSGFGMRMHPVLKKKMMHNGLDFSADAGTPIKSSANGTVRSAHIEKNYGNRVIIDHGSGFSTSYSQMEKYLVKTGQAVKKGEVIGYVGSSGLSTGPHLHYEVMKDGKYVDPADYLGNN